MLIFITGRPGVGKSTVCRRVIDSLKSLNLRVGGVICPEVRIGRSRVGFKIIDLLSSSEGWLAHVNFKTRVRVGKYGVNLRDLESIGVNAISKALTSADVIVIDEVGPMELKSKSFENAVYTAFKSGKPVIAVIHWRLSGAMQRVFSNLNPEVFEVTLQNRERLPEIILRRILSQSRR
ncbi:MAG: NTPase [archaeon GB-1867-005]|nr:NTPase [Candidatus Culexmicrobium cathedralense]